MSFSMAKSFITWVLFLTERLFSKHACSFLTAYELDFLMRVNVLFSLGRAGGCRVDLSNTVSIRDLLVTDLLSSRSERCMN